MYLGDIRAVVVMDTPEQVSAFHSLLWTFSSAAFIPHGYEGNPQDHPIWLTCDPQNVNDAKAIV